jgi:serine/threonine-protein kinase
MGIDPLHGDSEGTTEPLRLPRWLEEFDQAWRNGQRPRIEPFLERADLDERPALLEMLLKAEIDHRRHEDESPTFGEYVDRFPDQPERILAAFDLDTEPIPDGTTRQGAISDQSHKEEGADVLLGLVALQEEVLGRAELVAMIRVRFAEQGARLADLLRSAGLDPGEIHRLQFEAARRLKDEGGDVEAALAAAGPMGMLLAEIAGLDGRSFESTLDGVGSGRSAGIPGRVSPHCRYRKIRRHKAGGLGEVFLAQDLELNRVVALKQVRPEFARNPQARARLVLEGEVTGALIHPGIVPVYGLGLCDDGRPYYAMRFIEGERLKDAIDRYHATEDASSIPTSRSLEFRGLLGRFVAVCNTLEYAHSRGILHRDLKPGNIMLGPFGETLVVDWGITKVLGDPLFGPDPDEWVDFPGEPGRDGQPDPIRPEAAIHVDVSGADEILGTLRYASPEQVDRRLGPIGKASDIYGLGATFYQILTGRPPLVGDDQALIKASLLKGEIPPATEVAPGVPPALEAIRRTAMAVDPGERYPSARAIADDIERWLADQPIAVHRDDWLTRLSRWGRRHRTFLAASVALLTTSAVGLAIGFVASLDQQRQIQGLLDAATRNNDRLREQQTRAARANQLARTAIKQMLVKVASEKITFLPRVAPLRAELADEAVALYQGMLGLEQDDFELKRETAEVLYQDASYQASIGKFAENARLIGRSVALYEQLADQRPHDVRVHRALVFARMLANDALARQGPLARALDAAREIHHSAEELAARGPSSDHQFTEAYAAHYLAEFELQAGDPATALRLLRKGLGLIEPIQGLGPRERRVPVQILLAIGQAERELTPPRDPTASLDEALNRLVKLEPGGPSNPFDRLIQAQIFRERGIWLGGLAGRTDDAEAAFEAAIAIFLDLINDYPEYAWFPSELATTLVERARVRESRGPDRFDQAEADLDLAIEWTDRLETAESAVPATRVAAGRALTHRAKLALRRGDREFASKLATRSGPITRKLIEDNPTGRTERELDRAQRETTRALETPGSP